MKALDDWGRSIIYIIFFLINSLVFFLANKFFPANVVFGTHLVPKNLAFFWASAILTLVVWLSRPITKRFGLVIEGKIPMFFYYFLANSASIWILARLAQISGIGISRFYWAFLLGFAINILQMLTWELFKKYKLM